MLRLPLRRARRRARPPGDARHGRRGRDERPADAARRGHHRRRGGGARAGHDRRAGAPRPAVQGLPEPAGRTSTSRSSPCRSSRGTSLEGALNVRTRDPRPFTDAEIALLTSIASQVGQSIEHAKLYAQARRRVDELEALARISEAVSESLYLEESLEAIVQTTVESLRATGAAVVLEDGRIAWPEGRAGAHAVRLPLRWRGRTIGELVVDRDTPFSDDDRQLLDAIANQAAVALEHGRMALRGVLAQEIHHRVKNNLQTVASLLRLQARAEHVDPGKALDDSVNRILAIAAVHEELTEHRGRRRRPRRAPRPAARDARPGPRRREGRDRRARARRARRATVRRRSPSSSRSSCRTLSSTAGSASRLLLGARGATPFSPSPTTARACRTPPTEPGSRSSERSSVTSSADRIELFGETGLRVDVRFPA